MEGDLQVIGDAIMTDPNPSVRSPGLFATKDRDTGMASFVEHGPGKATFEGR